MVGLTFMHNLILFLLTFALGLGYFAVRAWRKRNSRNPADKSDGFRPGIGFTRLDGMASLSLLLDNRSKSYVWAEEIEIYLSDLVANDQTAEATFRQTQKIRQMVRRGDTLPISLCEAIYKAAGDPQRKYSCVMSSVLRYKIGEEQFEMKMENFRVNMMGLTAASVHRERKLVPPFPAPAKSPELPQETHAISGKMK